MVFPRFADTREAAGFVRETFWWRWRTATRAARPPPEDCTDLCPGFDRQVAERAAGEFGIPELAQAVFYTMILNDAVDLGVESVDMGMHMRRTLDGLRWKLFETWLEECRQALVAAHRRRRRAAPSPSSEEAASTAESRAGDPPASSDED